MQTALVTYLQAAPNTAETPGEAAAAGHAGSGMRVNSASRSGKNDTKFTTILEQGKGIAADTAPEEPGSADVTPPADADMTAEVDEEAAADACGLLAQLIVINTAAQAGGGQEPSGGKEGGRRDLISAVDGQPDAPPGMMPESIESAASVLNAQAEIELKGEAESNGRTAGPQEGKPPAASFDEVIGGIAGALKNELNRNGTAPDTKAAGTDTAAVQNPALPAENNWVSAAGDQSPALPDENNGVPTADRTGDIAVKSASVPSAGTAEHENADVPTIPLKTDADSGGSTSDGPGMRKKINGAAAAAVRPEGLPQDTGVKSAAITAEKAAAVERALNRFTDDIVSVRGGSREIRIVLEPETLGAVTISVIKNENGITAEIRSEDREIAAIISDQVHKLVSSMESKGIKVNDIDVAYSQTEQDTGFTRHGFSQARDESPRGGAPPAERDFADDTLNPEIWQTLYDGGTNGDTTVDYRV